MMWMLKFRPVFLTAISCTFVSWACGGEDLALPDLSDAAQLVVVSGNGQAGSVGSLLADPLVLRVLDSRGQPVPGTRVAFAAGSGASGSVVQPDTAVADGDGRVSVHWVLGSAAGSQVLLAKVVGSAAVSASFTATAGAGVAASIELVSGDGQAATAGSPLADSLIVRTLDAQGQPVAGITVHWAVGGGGSVSAGTTVTRADGRSGVTRTLGPTAGDQTTTATVDGVTGSPITFTSSATVGAVGALRIEVPPPATARSGVAFNPQPQVQLVDANNNPVAQGGLAVSVQVGAGPSGASMIGSATVSTNSQGLAVFTTLGISGPSGTYTLDFFAADAGGVTSPPIAVSAGEAVRLAMVTQPPASVTSGALLDPAPEVRLEDATGNGVAQAGTPVSVSLMGGGTLGGTLTVTTDADGHAAFGDLSISAPGGDHSLLFSASGLTSIESDPVHVVSDPDPGQSSIEAPDEVIAGDPAAVVVTVRDVSGAVLPGIEVSLTASGPETTIVPASATTDVTGSASFSFSSTKAESKTLSATAGSIPLGSVPVAVIPAAGDPSHTTAKVPDGRQFKTTEMTVDVYDRFGNHLVTGGDAVAATVTGANAGASVAVMDNGDGTYDLSYFALHSGDDQIAITLNGSAIAGSPFKSRVR